MHHLNSLIKNAGWESNSQLRPSTGTHDMKESLQLQYAASTSDGKWPTAQDCPGFEKLTKSFMMKCHAVSCLVMRLFAIGMGLDDEEWFTKVHDIQNPDSMSTLRCILYHDTHGIPTAHGYWRAGYLPGSFCHG
jgi:isopenicillin N synthase-like dioxygenase